METNPRYVRVGRRVLPQASWIRADILALPGMDLGWFDCAIATNPPFGAITRTAKPPGYTGRRFEYHTIAVVAGLARRGVFIVPRISAPFRYSGQACYRVERDNECARFERDTGITLEANRGQPRRA